MKASIKTWMTASLILVSAAVFGQQDCGPKFGTDSVMTVKNEAMFNQYYQQKNYVEVYPYWYYLFNNAPCRSKRITWNGAYIGKKYLKHLKDNDKEQYDVRKDGLIDTIILTYDARIKHWGDAAKVNAKKANDLFKLKPALRDSAMKLFEMSVSELGNATESSTPKYYMQAAIKMHKKKKYSLDSLFMLYFQLQDIIDYNLENSGKKKAKWVGTDTIVTKMMRPYLTCEKIEEFFKPKTDENGSDVALLKKVSNLLDVAKCNKTDYALDIAVKLYGIEPSGEAAIGIAKSYLGKDDKDEAISWYLKGVDELSDSTKMEETYQTLAGLSYKKSKYAEARKYANKALAINPNNGSAHLIIASVYMKGVSACNADGIDGASVYWAAADKALKAKTVDPSIAEQADAIIAQARGRFVSQTDAFFKNFPVAEGGSFVVPCFGVSTIVRFSK